MSILSQVQCVKIFDTLHSVKIHPVFDAIRLKGTNYEGRFYVLSL